MSKSAERWLPPPLLLVVLVTVVMLVARATGTTDKCDPNGKCSKDCSGSELRCLEDRLQGPRGPLARHLTNLTGARSIEPGELQEVTSLANRTKRVSGLQKLLLRNSRYTLELLKIWDFKFFTNLVLLDVSWNLLHDVPADVFAPLVNLESLDLAGNILNSLLDKDAFVALKSLRHLNLSYNQLGVVEPMWFRNLTRLEELDLRHNGITVVLPGIIEPLPSLNTLKLSENPLVDRDIGLLLGMSRHLQEFWGGAMQLVRIPVTLSRSIHGLMLHDNLVTAIYRGDLDSYPLLSNLSLANNKLQVIEDDALGRLEYLTELDLQKNLLSVVPDSLPRCLEILYLSDNEIRQIRASDFQGLQNLTFLDLSKNMIDSVEEDSFANLISLRRLQLANNPVSHLPSSILAGSVQLAYLDLNYFMVSTAAANQSVDTSFPIRSLERLETLKLRHSPVLAAQLLADNATLWALRSLRHLDLTGNGITIRSDLVWMVTWLEIVQLGGNFANCSDDLVPLVVWLGKLEDERNKTVDPMITAPKCLPSTSPSNLGRPVETGNATRPESVSTIVPTSATPPTTIASIATADKTPRRKKFMIIGPTAVVNQTSTASNQRPNIPTISDRGKPSQNADPGTSTEPVQDRHHHLHHRTTESTIIQQRVAVTSSAPGTRPTTLNPPSARSTSTQKKPPEPESQRLPVTTAKSKVKLGDVSATTTTSLQQTSTSSLTTQTLTSIPHKDKPEKRTTTTTTSSEEKTKKITVENASQAPPLRALEQPTTLLPKSDKSSSIAAPASARTLDPEGPEDLHQNDDPSLVFPGESPEPAGSIGSRQTSEMAAAMAELPSGTHPGMLVLLGAAIGAAVALTIVLSRQASSKRGGEPRHEYQRQENIEVHALTPTTTTAIDFW